MQAPPTIAPEVFTLFDAVNILSSVASLVLSVFAIWLTFRFKSDADKVNQDTARILIELQAESKAITAGVMSELRAYGDAMRGSFARNEVSSPLSVVPSSTPDLQLSGNRPSAPPPPVAESGNRERAES